MTWDFCEGNYFGSSSAAWSTILRTVSEVVAHQRARGLGAIEQINATQNGFPVRPCVINTDPPYYDNIAYSDLSDFFYVWLKHSLDSVWPSIFRRLSTPKNEELVATPYRHGGKRPAEAFFLKGMSEALLAMVDAATDDAPIVIYYAFKQAEVAAEGMTSAGWAAFLQAVFDSGMMIGGTWPLRTESAGRLIGRGANALASSIVLVCRRRDSASPTVTRAEFIRALKREMPDAIDDIRKAGVGPVDMQQSVIGPGMGVFTRFNKVLEDDDSAMTVKAALIQINRVWEEIDNELDTNFDPETQVALAWYATYGFDIRPSGEMIGLANAKNVSDRTLFASGVFKNLQGKTALTPRDELPTDWSPATDKTVTIWECVQHAARTLTAKDGGAMAAAKLVRQMGVRRADARTLAYRLFKIATDKVWAAEALVYNELAQEWVHLEDLAQSIGEAPDPAVNAQGTLI